MPWALFPNDRPRVLRTMMDVREHLSQLAPEDREPRGATNPAVFYSSRMVLIEGRVHTIVFEVNDRTEPDLLPVVDATVIPGNQIG